MALTSTLKNFTIPRKKREAGGGSILFEPCPKENREYSCIQSTLSESRLDVGKEIGQCWDCKNVRLVHNEKLLREFSEKRSEMRSKGRHGIEMEEKFCFLVAPAHATANLCENGLKAESRAQNSLGNPSYGVYLYRHVDVALRNAIRKASTPRNLIIFKVIFGKIKKLQCSLGRASSQDPVVQFDCYVSKDPAGPKDSLPQQALGSSVFIFDYNDKQELLLRPRQCLPYAVVWVMPVSNTPSPAACSTPVSSTRPPYAGLTPENIKCRSPSWDKVRKCSAERLKACTTAERQNAVSTMTNLRTTENSVFHLGQNSHGLGTATPFQDRDQVNTNHITTCPGLVTTRGDTAQQALGFYTQQQQWTSSFPSVLYTYPAPFMTGSVALGAPMDLIVPSSQGALHGVQNDLVSGQHSNICGSQTYQHQSLDPSTTSASSNMSTTVFSSRVVKDPRLVAREKRNSRNKETDGTEQDQLTGKMNSESNLMRELVPESQSGLHNELTGTGNGFRVIGKTVNNESQVCFQETFLNPPPGSSAQGAHEHSISQSKTMLQKRATCPLTMSTNISEAICSPEHVPLEKSTLSLDRPDFCDTIFHPNCSSSTDMEVPQNDWLCINASSPAGALLQKTPVDSSAEPQQRVGLQILSLSSNHFHQDEEPAQVISIPELCSSPSGDVDNTNLENSTNLEKRAGNGTVIKDREETEQSSNEVNVSNDSQHGTPWLASLRLTGKEGIPFLDGDTIYTDLPYEDPGSSLLEAEPVYEPSSDLGHLETKLVEEPISKNETASLKCANCKENANSAEVILESSSTRLIDESCPTANEDLGRTLTQINCPDLAEESVTSVEMNSLRSLNFKENPGSAETILESNFTVSVDEACSSATEDLEKTLTQINCPDLVKEYISNNETGSSRSENPKENADSTDTKLECSSAMSVDESCHIDGQDLEWTLTQINYPDHETESLSNNETESLRSASCKGNANSAGTILECNSTRSVDQSLLTASEELMCERPLTQISYTDLTQTRKHEIADISAQNSRGNPNTSPKTKGSSKRLSEDDLSLVQRCDTDLMDVACCEEVNDTDVLKEVMNSHAFSEATLTKCVDVQKDNLCKDSSHFQERETKNSTCCEVAHDICKVQSVDGLPDSIYNMLHNRIQFDQLFPSPSASGESSICDKPYLKPTNPERHPKNNTNDSDMFTFQNITPANQTYDNSTEEPNLDLKKPKCRNSTDQYNLRITIIADSRNTSFTELQILSSRISFAKCLEEQQDTSRMVSDYKSTITSNLSVTDSVGSEPSEVSLLAENENDPFKQILHNACDREPSAQSHSEIINGSSGTNKKQCNALGSVSDSLGEEEPTIQLPVTLENPLKRKFANSCSSSRNSRLEFHAPRKPTAKTVSLHQAIKTQGRLVICRQRSKPMFLKSKCRGIRNKMSTQEIFWRKENLEKSQIKRKTKSFLMNRKKSFASSLVKAIFSSSTLTNATINERTSGGRHQNQINNKVDLVPGQEVSSCPKSLALEGIHPSSSEPNNEAITELQNREEHEKNLPLSTQDNTTEYGMGSEECVHEDMSKQHTNTTLPYPDTNAAKCIGEKNENSGFHERQLPGEPVATKDIEENGKESRSCKATTSLLDDASVCQITMAPVETDSEICVNNDCDHSDGSHTLETEAEIAKGLTAGEVEAESNDTSKEKQEHFFSQELKRHTDTPSNEVGLIAELKNYLTRFESTINGLEPTKTHALGENRVECTLTLASETCQRDQQSSEQQLPNLDNSVSVALPLYNFQHSCSTSNMTEQENCLPAVAEEVTDKAHVQSEKTNRRVSTAHTLTRVYNPNRDLPNIRVVGQTNLTPEELQNWTEASSVTQCEKIALESNVIQDRHHKHNLHHYHPGHQTYTNNNQLCQSENIGEILDTSHLIRDSSFCSAVQQNSIYPCEASQRENIVILHNPWTNRMEANTNHHSNIDPKFITTSFPKEYSVGDISSTLKEADLVASLTELSPLRSKCREMLGYFIAAFERDQNVGFNSVCVSRELVMERYLWHPPPPVDLKYEALNSFLEMQMMMEATQFVENKLRSLSGEPTFRSLLWYDPTLKGELYKGKVGSQRQSSLYSSLQEGLAYSNYNRLQQCFSHVPAVLEHSQKHTETSHYMYLKNKRERLEIQTALQNRADMDSFFFSIPVSCIVNFGDNLESLEKLQKYVMAFTETYSTQMQGEIDIGKTEHLLIMHKFISEKINYLLSCQVADTKLSWFGLEHLQFDASKMLVWKDREKEMLYRSMTRCNDLQQQTFVRVNEAGVSLLKRQAVTEAGVPTQKKRAAVKDCKSQKQETVCKRRTRAQNKNDETNTVKNSCPANIRPQKPLAKSVENQGSHFQSVTPESANCTQYQPVNWSTIRAVPSQAIQVPMQPHKGMPKPWTIPSIPPSPCTETWAKEMCEKQNLQWRAPAPVVPNRFKATILRARLEARARLHTSQHVTVPHAQLKVAGVGGRGESRPTTPALAHPSWSPRCKHPWNSVWAESEPATGVLPHSGQYQNPQNQWDPALFPSQQSPLQPSTSLPQQGNSTQQPLHPHRAFMTTTKPPPFVYKPKALSYPFFLWNGHTYATANPAIVNTPHLSGTSLHQYPKMPRARFCLSDIAQHQPNQ